MTNAIFYNNKKFTEATFNAENLYEDLITKNAKLIFGEKSIYINIKNKIESKSLGKAIPDGILFNLADIDNPEFYLVEIELSFHDFFNHIFPQVTKFFAFFKNPKSEDELIERVFSIVNIDSKLNEEFKKYIGRREIFKFIKDTVENSPNILLIMDDYKEELDEIKETYTDTWDKIVQILLIKEYKNENESIITVEPDFEKINLPDAKEIKEEKQTTYNEEFHLEGVDDNIKELYRIIKLETFKIDDNLIFNPQHYYISIRKNKNFSYLDIKRKKIRLTVMYDEKEAENLIKFHKIKHYGQGIQNFYGDSCFGVLLEDDKNLDEIINLLKLSYKKYSK